MGKTLPKDQGSSDTQKKTGQQESATVPILRSGNIAKNLSEVPCGSHLAKNLVKCTKTLPEQQIVQQVLWRGKKTSLKKNKQKKDSKTNKF